MDKRRTRQFGPSAAVPHSTPEKAPRKPLSLHEAVVRMEVKGKPFEKPVRLANIPKNGLSRVVLLQIRTCFGKDVLFTEEFECYRVGEITCPALAPVDEGAPPPDCPGPALFRRLRVKMRSTVSEVVEVANIPATAEGLQLFHQLVRDYGGYFQTADYGWRELADVEESSIDDLNPLMTACG